MTAGDSRENLPWPASPSFLTSLSSMLGVRKLPVDAFGYLRRLKSRFPVWIATHGQIEYPPFRAFLLALIGFPPFFLGFQGTNP